MDPHEKLVPVEMALHGIQKDLDVLLENQDILQRYEDDIWGLYTQMLNIMYPLLEAKHGK